MRPPFMPRPISMVPQWPRVVAATMLQFPSSLPAVAGGTEQMTANAAVSKMARVRLLIMGSSFAGGLGPPNAGFERGSPSGLCSGHEIDPDGHVFETRGAYFP